MDLDDELHGSVLSFRIANVVGLLLNDNSHTEIDVSQNSNLKFVFDDNNILRRISTRNFIQFEKIDVSKNAQLNIFSIEGNPGNVFSLVRCNCLIFPLHGVRMKPFHIP